MIACLSNSFFIETHIEEKHDEDVSDSLCPDSYTKTCQLFEEVEDEATLPYIEQFEKEIQDQIVHFSNHSLKQVSMENQKASLFAL